MTMYLLLWFATQAPQDPPEERPTVRLSDSSPRVSSGPDLLSLTLEAAPEESEDEFVAAPIPSYNPTTGAGLALGAGYLFQIGPKGPQSRPSMVGGGVFYSQSGTWAAGGGLKLHLDEDRWRLTALGAGGEFFYGFTGIGADDGDRDQEIDLALEAISLQLEALRRISGPFFGGLRFRAANVRTRLHDSDLAGPVGARLADAELDTDIAGAGLHAQWDTRDSSFYPTSGGLADLLGDFFEEELGSDVEYQTYSLAYNHYIGLDPNLVVAFRGYARAAAGDVPFFALSYLGNGADLRGYTVGTYQDRVLVAGQFEYRWRFHERWVAVAFAGMGGVARELDEFDRDDLLPSVGAGLRFTIAPENKISLRFDVAFGKEDSAFYLGVGEAF